ncbi:hypothetical protein BpHYR1_040360 [Brachionus plicatilis]|uniref:Uncharacterized protein n=1 Tax=Brachionus plicatilis TaxID=10195 RepID=A0A3M7QY34_BRAPC|nr:hypothetical protein BpHYR1_040360 [Brachionus plicatilis]
MVCFFRNGDWKRRLFFAITRKVYFKQYGLIFEWMPWSFAKKLHYRFRTMRMFINNIECRYTSISCTKNLICNQIFSQSTKLQFDSFNSEKFGILNLNELISNKVGCCSTLTNFNTGSSLLKCLKCHIAIQCSHELSNSLPGLGLVNFKNSGIYHCKWY